MVPFVDLVLRVTFQPRNILVCESNGRKTPETLTYSEDDKNHRTKFTDTVNISPLKSEQF